MTASKPLAQENCTSFLESKQDFSNWIKNRIEKYGLVENQDYSLLNNFIEQTGRGGHNRIEYALTIDAAKELAMVEGNDKGKQARQYFISCEKKMQELAKPLSTFELMQYSLNKLIEQDKRVLAVERDIFELKASANTRPNYFTIVGYATLHGLSVNLKIASMLGREASKICKANGYMMDSIPDPRFGLVRMYPENVMKQVFNIFEL